MPTIKKNCKYRLCNSIGDYPNGYCQEHQEFVPKPWNYRRLSFHKEVYNTHQWRKIRERVLKASPLCEVCNKNFATEVDHIVPLIKGGEAFSIENLQSICYHCHKLKTNHEKRKGP